MKTCKQCGRQEPAAKFEAHRHVCYRCRGSSRKGEKQRAKALKYLYGISIEQYDAMLTEQGGVCKVCGRSDNGPWARLAVDHNHRTGRVRGLLCAKCNKGLGQFNDDNILLRKAATYLEGSL